MKKVIVFRVENVLVKDYDEVKMFDLKMRRLVKEMLKKEGLEMKGNEWEEKEKMIVLGCEEDVEKMEGMGVKSVLGVKGASRSTSRTAGRKRWRSPRPN